MLQRNIILLYTDCNVKLKTNLDQIQLQESLFVSHCYLFAFTLVALGGLFTLTQL